VTFDERKSSKRRRNLVNTQKERGIIMAKRKNEADESDESLRSRAKRGIAGSDDSGGADDHPKPSADLTHRHVVMEGDKLKGAPTGRDKGELIGHETVHTRQSEVRHDSAMAAIRNMKGIVVIPIITILIAACATLGFLYVQESNKLEDAQQAINKHIENNTSLQAEVNSLQGEILALEAEVETLSESLDTATAAARNPKE
jgi:cell division protein FtsB